MTDRGIVASNVQNNSEVMMIVRTVGTVTALLHLLLVLALETAGRLSNPAHCHSNGEGE